MKYVIIGNSAAGIGAVEGIRQIDKDGEITVYTSEPYHTYSRPLISYLLQGKTTAEKCKYRGDGFYADNNVKLVHETVTEVDAKAKTVTVKGERVPYDKLLVAAGSSAFVPPIDGIDSVAHKFTFIGMSDALALDKLLDSDKRVLIVGAGLIGLKCAEGIRDRVRSITVVDVAPRILPAVLDGDSAKIVQSHIESKGIKFMLSAGVSKFSGNTAVTDGGERIEFDILVMAAGVRPNTALLKDIAEIGKGIIVNERSQTSAEDIYAAGDCTQTTDISSGENKIMALLPNAYMQGECAGINMASGDKVFDRAIPMNAAGFFGLHIITAGNYTGNVYEESRNKRLFYSDNRLNGYILIGNDPSAGGQKQPVFGKAGIYTSLIREKTPLDSIDFELICKSPGLMAFTKEDRAIKLGGAVG